MPQNQSCAAPPRTLKSKGFNEFVPTCFVLNRARAVVAVEQDFIIKKTARFRARAPEWLAGVCMLRTTVFRDVCSLG